MDLKSLFIKFLALVAFLAINMISYRAFSLESAIKTDLTTQIEIEKNRESSEIPICQIVSEGYVDKKWKQVRIQVGEDLVAGANSVFDLALQLKLLVEDHKCKMAAEKCNLIGEGLALGSWVKHRVEVKEGVDFGGNTTSQLFVQINELKKIGLCQ